MDNNQWENVRFVTGSIGNQIKQAKLNQREDKFPLIGGKLLHQHARNGNRTIKVWYNEHRF